jgi:hypothetical protein
MNPTLEELSDFWQDVLHVRCKHNVPLAMLRVIDLIDQRPHTRDGQFAQALLDFLGGQANALQELGK